MKINKDEIKQTLGCWGMMILSFIIFLLIDLLGVWMANGRIW
jgi:hypothetical protein